MSRSIRSTAAPANQKQTEFIQSILAKYGLTRWRRKLKSLILRHNPLYAAEPETLQRTDMVTNHIHQSFYYPAVTGRTIPDRQAASCSLLKAGARLDLALHLLLLVKLRNYGADFIQQQDDLTPYRCWKRESGSIETINIS